MPGFTQLNETEASELHAKDLLIELKIDGSRHTWKNGQLISDREIVRNERYVHIAKVLAGYPGLAVRGEVALPNSNVLRLNRRESWPYAKYYLFDLYKQGKHDWSRSDLCERRERLEQLVKDIGSPHITIPQRFKSFNKGWNFVKDHDSEGLVLKSNYLGLYKCKSYKEAKCLIVGHIPGKLKGAFQISFKGHKAKVSAASVDYVKAYKRMTAQGKKVFAEIEYLLETDDGIPFQPALRRIGTKADLSV